jgi:predicted glutamine amidotransferase
LLIQVDFATETTVNDVVTVIATQALTTNETWQSFEPNELMVFEQGELNYQVKATD